MFVVYAMLTYLLVAAIIASFVLRGVRRRHAGDSFRTATGAPGVDAHLLHRATLRGRRVRFYRSPLVGPDFPWTALRDLFEVATDGARYDISAEWIYANNPTLAQPILTENGAELLLSHWAGLEVLTSLAVGSERAALIAAFREVMAEAYVLQWADLTREEFLALCALASRRPHAHTNN
jgi:hypothetical protein